MNRINLIATILSLVLLLTFCTKENNKKYCWQGFAPEGSDIPGLVLCAKTEAEVQAGYPQYVFYKQGEEEDCWTVQFQQQEMQYIRHVPASIMKKTMSSGSTYSKVDCSSFCI